MPQKKVLKLRGLPAGVQGAQKALPFEKDVPWVEPPQCGKPQIDLGEIPKGLRGKGWTKKDERQYVAIRDSCLSRKKRCTTKRTKAGKVRKCYRDCERVAAATVNKRRKTRKKKR